MTTDWRKIEGVLNMVLDRAYCEWIRSAGMVPVALPSLPKREAELVNGLHAIVLSGGGDIRPELFASAPEPFPGKSYSHVDRSAFEFTLVWRSVHKGLPLLGICLGCQTVNVALGGGLIRDLDDPKCRHGAKAPGAGNPRHRLRVAPGSVVGGLYDSRNIRVSSTHHQAVGRLAGGFRASAWGPGGVVEAIENPGYPHILAVQWHPEMKPRSRFSKRVAGWLRTRAAIYAEENR